MSTLTPLISIVVPVYNEAAGVEVFHDALIKAVKNIKYEIIYVDDGSKDTTSKLIAKLAERNTRVRLAKLSRNFGKENALTAGMSLAGGQAVIMIDGDNQHPPEVIKQLIAKWQAGAQVVVGIRTGRSSNNLINRTASNIFYRIFNRLTGQQLVSGSADFRLLDRVVLEAFLNLKERDRITRGLIDWLGFKRELVYFEARPRTIGDAVYDRQKRFKLATDSFVSLSPRPLYMFSYLGGLITLFALAAGITVFVEQFLMGDPLDWNFTGTAMLGILTIFLVGIVLLSQGVISLYISHIHTQSKQRPLYIIDRSASVGISRNDK